ncbi:probable DNA double-strand break repair Rad50 ATPase [Xenopus laevis]|uniref:Probable DNA double-strand break repair Rad50 ATPase n=1 Tax=Xenopus laevis TaxID=8355 RepID=A0A8J0V0J4_XENLA|nr:probable DNA double-strand break repair Rad50 ATPase [Xenopus laevis]
MFFRTSSEASLPDLPRYSLAKPYTTSYEISRFLQKCQKERDEAYRREELARDKLNRLEITARSQIQELKTKLKEVTNESKALHRTVKKLRLDLGLEGNPKFKGKMTKDVIKELQEKEEQCSRLKEDNGALSVQLKAMIPVITQTQKQKAEVEKQLQNSERKLQELQNENHHTSQLLQDSQRERDEFEKAYIILKKSIDEAKQHVNRSVQTTTSIPVSMQSSIKRIPRDTPSSQSFQARRKISLDPPNHSATTDRSTHKPYLSTAHS